MSQELKRAAVMVREYMAHHAILVRLAPIWHEKLYMHTVSGKSGIDLKLIDELDDVMNSIMSNAHEDIAIETAACVARCTFTALTEVLLNGGEFRNFVSEDAHIIMEDVVALKVRS